jgi:uncharacterized membrane protein YgcG
MPQHTPHATGHHPDGLSGVTELRLHGVGGTSPGSLLGDLAPTQVAGDRIAGFYRTADHEGRHVEAYSWGGLTSGSSWRVLWLVLLPFALANMAAHMFPPWLADRPVRFRLFRWAARLASFGLTLNLVLLAAAVPIDYVAYQCGGVPSCARWPAWVLPPDLPAVRILVGALAPLLLIGALYLLAHTTQNRYDQIKPAAPDPGKERRPDAEDGFPGLSDPAFWNGVQHTRVLTRLHVAGSLALVAALVAWTAHGVRPVAGPWLWPLLAVPAAVVALCAIELRADTAGAGGRWRSWALLGVAGAAVAGAAVLAVSRPPGDPLGTGPHELPGLQVFMDAVYGVVFLTLFLVPVTLVAGAWTRENWAGFARRTVLVAAAFAAGVAVLAIWGTDSLWIWIGTGLGIAVGAVGALSERRSGSEGGSDGGSGGGPGSGSGDGSDGGSDGGGGRFRWAAPFVVLGVAMAVLNTFMLATLLLVAEWLGTLRPCHDPRLGGCLDVATPPGGEPPIAVFPLIRNITPYLVAVPLLLVTCFALYQLARWLISGRTGRQAVFDYYCPRDVAREPHPEWWVSTVARGPVPEWQRRLVRRWPGRVARARRLARAPRDLDLLLTAVAVVGGVLFVWIQWRLRTSGGPPANPNWLITACSGAAMLLPALLLVLLRLGWKDERHRRSIGVLWDVATFWPRHSHPLAPPSYAERAVPELQRRLWWLHDNGGIPLLAAHSQGSIIAVAALAQADARPVRDRVALVTFGSPLRTLYAWGFPAYFGEALFRRLAYGPGIKVACWRNFWCDTDYIGGPVRDSAVDERLPDPPTSRFLYGQPLPRVGAHTGFWADEELRRQVSALAANLAGPPPRP